MNTLHRKSLRSHGAILMELVVACALLTATLLPIAFGLLMESKAVARCYWDTVVMETLDGEMEVLAAGAWMEIPVGEHPYSVTAESTRQLSRGTFWTVRTSDRLRIEWRPDIGVQRRIQKRDISLP